MYIKYFTSDLFNKKEFVKLLRYTMNVESAVVEDGVILDLDAFNAVSKAVMPHWAFINSRFINSKLHTRPATPEEFKVALNNDTIEQFYIIRDDYYDEYDRVTAREWDKLKAENPNRYIFIGEEPTV